MRFKPTPEPALGTRRTRRGFVICKRIDNETRILERAVWLEVYKRIPIPNRYGIRLHGNRWVPLSWAD